MGLSWYVQCSISTSNTVPRSKHVNTVYIGIRGNIATDSYSDKWILHVILPKKHPCHVNLWTFTSFSYPIPISTTILPWQPLFDYFYTCIRNVNHLKYGCRYHLKSHFIDILSQNHVLKPCRMESTYNFILMTLLSTIFTWKLYLLHTMIDKITTSCVSLHID